MNLDLGEKPVFTATWLGEGDGLTNEVVLCVCVCVCVFVCWMLLSNQIFELK